jgi:hypothetical protein
VTADDASTLAEVLRAHAAYCRAVGSPFYADLMEHMADDARAGGPTLTLAAPDARDPGTVYRLRVLGGVHRLVLAGDAPDLAQHFPTTGGDGDAAAAWPLILARLIDPPPAVLDALRRPPQTNEVGRSAALVGGFLLVARDTGLPLCVLELGSSAGLNLRFDRYWYEEGEAGFGDPASPVRFEGLWNGSPPPFGAACVVAERRGCDRDPIDATTDEGRLTLLSYVWPGQTERFALLSAALEVARREPVTIEQSDVTTWLDRQLETSALNRATVVFHSVVWPYLSDAERAHVADAIAAAGADATSTAPLAWLRLEGLPDEPYTELRLTIWPGGDERLLATASWHIGPISWQAD